MLHTSSQHGGPVAPGKRFAYFNALLRWRKIWTRRLFAQSTTPTLDTTPSTDLATFLTQADWSHTTHPLVLELAHWIAAYPSREKNFNEAMRTANTHELPELAKIKTLQEYLNFLSKFLRWTPTENVDGTAVYRQCLISYFVLSQPSVAAYQNDIYPGSSVDVHTWLSDWMVRFGLAFGAYMDEPASMNEKSMATFRDSPKFKVDDYIEPECGWTTFNEFFSRQAKPEKRPIASPKNPKVWTSPADCTFVETFEISDAATVTVKTMQWTILELLDSSPYAAQFAGGLLVHGFLGVYDFHRFSAPVAGQVLEARRIVGRHYCMVDVVDADDSPYKRDQESSPPTHAEVANAGTTRALRKTRMDCPVDLGFEMAQTRGLVIFDTPDNGLVAVIPVGMAMCSSVNLTVKPGDEVAKGQEFGYFRFGGSDAIILFSKKPEVNVQVGVHLLMGERVGRWLD